MVSVKRVALVGAVALMVLVPFLSGWAEEGEGDAAAFAAGLEKVDELMKRERWGPALDEIRELLGRHTKRDYVLAKRMELEALVQRCAFRVRYPEPKPEDVLSGRLLRCVLQSGSIKVQYTPETAGDFGSRRKGLLEHPARFTGPFHVEISGRSYPDRADDSPQVIVGGVAHPKTGRSQAWQVICGSPPRDEGRRQVWLPAKIIYHDGSTSKEVASKEKSPGRPGKPYKIVVKVGSKRVSATLNGKSLGSAAKSSEVFGGMAFDAEDWNKVILSGTVEPSWIQGKLDKVEQDQLKAFRKKFRRETYLPKWLLEGAAPTASKPRGRKARYPGDPSSRQRSSLDRIARQLEGGEVLKALVRLETLGEAQAPKAAVHYLRARAWLGLYQLAKAKEDVEASLKLAPDFLGSLLLQAKVLDRMGLGDEAGRVYAQAIEKHTQDADAYEEAALHHLVADALPVAKGVTELAVSRGVRTRELDALGRGLVVADKGPSWGRVHEYKSANYHVLTDIDRKTSIEAARLLEEAYSAYRATLEYVREDRSRHFKVYLFSGQSGFARFMKDLGPLGGEVPDRVAGLYSPLLKQLLIWNLPSRDAMMETVRHEGFHQYLDRFMRHPPVWFNEGLAVYYEHAPRVGGRLKLGRVQPEYVDVLRKSKLVPLERFLFLSRGAFYGAGVRSYAQAWALMHMLRHGDSGHRAIFKKLMEGLQQASAAETLSEVFTEERIKELDADLREYVAGLTK